MLVNHWVKNRRVVKMGDPFNPPTALQTLQMCPQNAYYGDKELFMRYWILKKLVIFGGDMFLNQKRVLFIMVAHATNSQSVVMEKNSNC